MSLWPNRGKADTRPPLGSGYQRVEPVTPNRPIVPAGAPGELRLDAKKVDGLPDSPYSLPAAKEQTMTGIGTPFTRTLGPADSIPNDLAVPYYLEDRKLRV